MRESDENTRRAQEFIEESFHLGEDTDLRAEIAFEIMSKALNFTKLVRVQRTVYRRGRPYTRNQWVRPDEVQKDDVILRNRKHFDEWQKDAAEHSAVAMASGQPPKSKTRKRSLLEGAVRALRKLASVVRSSRAKHQNFAFADVEGLNIPPQQRETVKVWAKRQQEKDQPKRDRRERQFADTHFSPGYRIMLINRLNNALPGAQKAFDKYVPNVADCIAEYSRTGRLRSFYLPDTDTVHYNMHDDAKKGGASFFHEFGHLIDHRSKLNHMYLGAGDAVSFNREFLIALEADVRKAESDVIIAKKQMSRLTDRDLRRIRTAVGKAIVSDGMNATLGVQDVFCAVIGENYPGTRYGHREEKEYWTKRIDGSDRTPEEIIKIRCAEAFADMFEASTNDEMTAAMQKWFPSAFEWFRKTLELIAEESKDDFV